MKLNSHSGERCELLTELELCLTCATMRGPVDGKEQRCLCEPKPDSWRGNGIGKVATSQQRSTCANFALGDR